MDQDPRRVELQTILETILESENVYFQPPESMKLSYPCIVYNRTAIPARYASNDRYWEKTKYTVALISRDPDAAALRKKLRSIPYCSYDRHFNSDNLSHDVYELYF